MVDDIEFQNLIGMLGSGGTSPDENLKKLVSKPYRYARKLDPEYFKIAEKRSFKTL